MAWLLLRAVYRNGGGGSHISRQEARSFSLLLWESRAEGKLSRILHNKHILVLYIVKSNWGVYITTGLAQAPC